MELLKEFRRKTNLFITEYNHYNRLEKEEADNVASALLNVGYAMDAQQIILETAQVVQESVHKQIATIVSKCLEMIFDDPYEFKIYFDRKYGRTEARMVFIRNGQELPIKNAVGGGVLDVTAFALRLACLHLTIPSPRKIFIADEPFKNINGEKYQAKVGQMLTYLSQEMGVQMIIVSDDEWLKIGKVIDLEEI